MHDDHILKVILELAVDKNLYMYVILQDDMARPGQGPRPAGAANLGRP